MVGDSVSDWQELSALYERADALALGERAAWFDTLRGEQHRLLPQLERMFDARTSMASDGFMSALPRIGTAETALPSNWGVDSQIGSYRLLRHVGSGGMAEVWLAERCDGAFERRVAIKLLFNHPTHDQRDTFAERFRRERDILASLNHLNIATLHDAGVTDTGQPWLALEYIEGAPITAWCDQRRLTIAERVRLFLQILVAVEHAHANLVLHRDLKPSNILVDESGRVCLLDFGIAKLLESPTSAPEATELTHRAGRPLTLRYASPEQIGGSALTTRSDVYSLGVVLHELLTGASPYDVSPGSERALADAIGQAEARPPSRRSFTEAVARLRQVSVDGLRKALRPDLDAIVLCALRKEPEARYPSVLALHEDLGRWLRHEAVLATAPSVVYRFRKFVRRHRKAVVVGGFVTTALIAATVVTALQSNRAQDESRRAAAAKAFLLDTLWQSDPSQSQGGAVKASELLDAGLDRANRTLVDQPRLRAEVLRGIATIDQNLGRYVEAETILRQAAGLFDSLALPRELAATRLELAGNALQMGDTAAASSYLDLVHRQWDRLGADDGALAAKDHEVRGWLFQAKGELPAAKIEMEASWQQAKRVFGENDSRTADALRGLAWIEQEMRNYDGARQHIALAASAISLSRNATATERIGVEIEEARIEYSAGDLRRAQVRIASALPRCAAALGPSNENCFFLVVVRVLLALQIGSANDARVDLPLLLETASDDRSPRRQFEATTIAARVLAANGGLQAHGDLVYRLRAVAARPAAPGPIENDRARAMLTLAEVELRAGQYVDAGRALQPLLEGDAPHFVEIAFRARARMLQGLLLQKAGLHGEALAMLITAEADFGTAFGPEHTDTKICQLYGLPSAVALGRSESAYRQGVTNLAWLVERLPDDAPLLSKTRRWLKELKSGPAGSSSAIDAGFF
ncbi:MAG: protein kinase [Caldimonas sp.]